MAEAKIFYMSVSGDDATMVEGMKVFCAGLEAIAGYHEPKTVAALAPADAMALSVTEAARSSISVRRGKVAAAVKAVRRSVSKNTPAQFQCSHCDRVLASAQGRGKHESSEHPKEFAARKSGLSDSRPADGRPAKKYYPCGHNGCLKEFISVEKRDEHWGRDHA